MARLARGREGLKLPRLQAADKREYVYGLPLALEARAFEFVAVLPADEGGQIGRVPAQREAEAGHGGVAGEVHLGMIFVAWLVVVLLDVFLLLLQAPGFGVSLVFHAFVDRERRNAYAS